jgi:hypothetical protein
MIKTVKIILYALLCLDYICKISRQRYATSFFKTLAEVTCKKIVDFFTTAIKTLSEAVITFLSFFFGFLLLFTTKHLSGFFKNPFSEI